MIIIKMKGGLGNQMFQYALYKQLKAMGKEVKVDEVNGFRDDKQRDPVLGKLFGITYDLATEQEITDITDSHMDFLSRVKRKIFGRKSLEYIDRIGTFNPEVLEKNDAYLNGYFQSERYFPDRDVRNQLRQEFHLDIDDILTKNDSWQLYRDITQTESVSIHVRRGDYLEPGTVETFGGICDTAYYKRAIERMLTLHPDAVFFVFTSDKQWCEENVSGDRFHLVDTGEENEDAVDLLLMSMCKHHILANSSFSWWSAWINDSPEKTVLVPPKWLNNEDNPDIYTDRMIRV